MSISRPRAADGAFIAAATSAAMIWLLMLLWYRQGWFPYDGTSGVWAALGQDFAHGTLYRPLHSDLGYGGTRYMPLLIVMQGLLLRAGVGAVAAGTSLTLASLILFTAGFYAVMRVLGVSRVRALAAAIVPIGCISMQLITIAIRVDLLAAGLVLWGFYFALQRHTVIAATCWALAFAAKMSAPWGAVAFAIAAAQKGEGTAGIRALFGAAALSVIALFITILASDGRMLASFAAAADGGATLRYALAAPWWLLYSARQDPFFIGLTVIAIVFGVRRVRRVGFDPAVVWLLCAVLATLVIFATPGADSNHFPDLIAASVLMIALEAPDREAVGVMGIFAIAQLGQLVPDAPSIRHYFESHGRPTSQAVQRIQHNLSSRGITGPVLSENPLLPIEWGQRAEVSDPFNLRLLAARDPSVRSEFSAKLRRHYYRSVVLVDWTGDLVRDMETPGPASTRSLNFPAGFYDEVKANYRVTTLERPMVVLEPRP